MIRSSAPGNGSNGVPQTSWPDGSEAGEAAYAVNIKLGETIYVGNGRPLRILDVVDIEEEGSLYVGLLKVEVA